MIARLRRARDTAQGEQVTKSSTEVDARIQRLDRLFVHSLTPEQLRLIAAREQLSADGEIW